MIIKESNLNSSSGPNTTITNATNPAWRTFKGRLYTRLHDKRIAELDLAGILNVSYLFYILIKCFSLTSLSSTQLRYEQVESYFRLLNIFIKSKNLQKLDAILMLSSSISASSSSSSSNANQIKTNACKILLNCKFTALRLWFDSADFVSNSESNPNSDEIEIIIRQEFIVVLNEWLTESHARIQGGSGGESEIQSKSGNQIVR